MVMSLNTSIALTLDNFFARQRYDIIIAFNRDQRADRVISLAESVEGVDKAEIRVVQQASMFVAGQLVKEAGLSTSIRGVSSRQRFFQPLIVAGRWLVPQDGQALVIPRETAEKNKISWVTWLPSTLVYWARINGR